MKQSLIGLVAITIIASGFFLPGSKNKAAAQILGLDLVAIKWDTPRLIEWAKRMAGEVMKKRILDVMVNDIINWINGNGDPRFVTDWSQFLSDAANIAVGDFANEVAPFLCTPFREQIRIALLPVDRFQNQITCTLDQITGNIDRFYNDFRSGGWIALNAQWETQNTPWGSFFLAKTEQNRRANAAAYAAEKEATVGGGFLSTKSCEETPGATGPDIDKDGKSGDIASTCTITTPGSVVAHLANQAIGIDIPYLLESQDIERYLSSIVNAVINRLLRTGVEGLQGLTSGGGSDYTAESQCAGLTGQLYTDCLSFSGGSLAGTRSSLLTLIDPALTEYRQAVTILTDAKTRSQNYKDFLNTTRASANANVRACVTDQDLKDVSDSQLKIETELSARQAAVSALEKAKTDLAALKDDWDALSAIIADTSGYVDEFTAAKAKEAAIKERNELFGSGARGGPLDEPEPVGKFTRRQQEINICKTASGGIFP